MRSFFSRMREGREGGGSPWGGRGREGASKRGGDRSRGGRSRSKKSEPKPKIRVTVDMPESFQSQDTDNDGQIGLYEWMKTKSTALASFRKMDSNGDGFLTPRELQAGSGEAAEASGEGEEDEKSDSDSKDGASKSKTAGKSKSSSSGDGDAKKKASAMTARIAALVFRGMDKDKDDKLSAEEWKNARQRTKDAFKKKGIELTPPVDKAKFIAIYPSRS